MSENRAVSLFQVFMADTVSGALTPVLRSGYVAAGEQVRQFERALAAYAGNPRVTAMSDASGALTLALFMAGVRPGTEVVTSPLACTATTMPIANLFAQPVWCDVNPMTGMPDGFHVAEKIGPRTRAVLIYHWSGDVADLDAVRAVAARHGAKIIDDASEAFGAEYKGRHLGDNGMDFTVYSFHAVKHLTTGEGAALFAANDADFERARWLKRYGIHQPTQRLPSGDLDETQDIPVAGFNFAMNNIAAAIGIEQMRNADFVVSRARDNGAFYERALKGVGGLRLLARRADSHSAYWTYTMLAERRGHLAHKLKLHGIACQRLHLRNDRYSCFGGHSEELPGVLEFDAQNLSIPCGWWVTEEDRSRVASLIREGW